MKESAPHGFEVQSDPAPEKGGWLHSRAIELYGWAGVIVVVGAYCLMSLGVVTPGATFYLANLLGSIGIALVAYRDSASQPFWLNVVWSVFAVVGIAVSLFGGGGAG